MGARPKAFDTPSGAALEAVSAVATDGDDAAYIARISSSGYGSALRPAYLVPNRQQRDQPPRNTQRASNSRQPRPAWL
jgi:hypothetical protein